MFYPISPNVIRQSLSWTLLPPCQIECLTSTERSNGDQVAEYRLTFSSWIVTVSWVRNPCGLNSALWWVNHQMRGAFCDDILPSDAVYSDDHTEIYVYLSIFLAAKEVVNQDNLSWLL